MEFNRSAHKWWCYTTGCPVLMAKRRPMVMVVVVVVVAAVCVLLLARMVLYSEESQRRRKFMEDSYLAMSWEGFGPEKGVYTFTVVTAMLDIGRGRWARQKRPYNTYLLYMQRVLRLDVNLVVFVDSKALPFVLWMRRGREARTHVVRTDLRQLPYYSYRDHIQSIMDSQEYQQDNELVRKGLCESQIPEYDIVQWSKLHFLNESITLNPFHNDYFAWIDGGYGHGEDVHPADGIWRPANLLEHGDRVTFMEREPVERYRAVAGRLHKMSINILAGLFFAGGKRALQRLYELQRELIADWMRRGVVDDDQTVYMLLYFRNPELFRLVPGDWNDVFRLFHRTQPQRHGSSSSAQTVGDVVDRQNFR
ncbi:protein HtrL-like [Babylonia areolata]|uniref:protein HtrL-like n=1 Tax=Babylonia areolata TaxID=304850 RepID=UPI003FD253AD